MKRVIKYKAIDPYYSDVTQTYIGSSAEELDNIQYETEKHMKGSHFSLSSIYETEYLVDESDITFNDILQDYQKSHPEEYDDEPKMLYSEGIYYGEDEDTTNEDI